MDGQPASTSRTNSRQPLTSGTPRDSSGDPLVETPYTPTELKAIQREAKHIINIPNDCWGAFVFLVVNDFPDLRAWKGSTAQMLRVLQVTICWLLNVVIQGILVYTIYKRLLLPAQLSAQDLYKMFHDEAYQDQALSQDLFDQIDNKGDLCGLAIGLFLFNRVILFLWISTNVREFVDISIKLAMVLGLPALPAGCASTDMVEDRFEGGAVQHCAICADWVTKMTLCIFVYIPKLIIASVVTYAGSVWLLASESIADLILNSLALSFVTQVDELIATSFFPGYFQRLLQRSSWCIKPVAEDPTRSHINSIVILTFAIGVVELTIRTQTIIPGFQNDLGGVCWSYLHSQHPWCSPGEEECFPLS